MEQKGNILGGLLLNDITYLCIWNIYKGKENGEAKLLNVYWQTILSLAYTWVNYIFMC